MPKTHTFSRSFNGGEISPEMYGQIADGKYQSGLKTARNVICSPQGTAYNRAGLAYVRGTKYPAKKARLIPFTFNTSQTVAIEIGEGYFRFHTAGATILDSYGAPVEASNSYIEADLFELEYEQSGDIITFTHPSYPPMLLSRLSATSWSFEEESYDPPISAPGGVSVSPYVPSSASINVDTYTAYYYQITSVMSDDIKESEGSTAESGSGNLYVTGARNTITWDAVSGAKKYNVYRMVGGVYCYLGTTTTTTFVDTDITPDGSKTPPIYDAPFSNEGQIVSVPVTNGGSNYGSTGGMINSITVINSPWYWDKNRASWVLTLSDPTGSGAVLAVGTVTFHETGAIDSYSIDTINVTSAGSGYTNPTITPSDNMELYSGYWDYTIDKNPVEVQLSVTDTGGGTGALLRATVVAGVITDIVVVNPGRGYVSPVVSITNAIGGSGAVIGTPVVGADTDYPSCVTYHQQRKCFAGTTKKPQNLWMTKSGTEDNMSYSLPIRDDDRIAFRIAARQMNRILHMVPLGKLILLTSAAEQAVTALNGDVLTPTSIGAPTQSYIGANEVRPIVVNTNLIYGAARGGHVREMAYSWQANGYATGDLSLRAAHLFDNMNLVDSAYSKAPKPIVWFVSDSGKLLGLTYVPEQQVGAWHWHDTDGTFESCCCVAENNEDFLYVIVKRTINGNELRYVERMATRQYTDPADAFFVDCGGTYSGAATKTLTGLDWLEGKTVSILADGAVHPQRVVTGGSITLQHTATKVQVGLPYNSDAVTLPPAFQEITGFGQGVPKNINKCWIRLNESSGISVGPDEDNLTPMKNRTTEPYGNAPEYFTGVREIVIEGEWNMDAQLFVRQSEPLPMEIVSITMEIAIGG
jgi:hypothetical protein